MKMIIKVEVELEFKEDIKLEGNLVNLRKIESQLQLNLIERMEEFIDEDVDKEVEFENVEKTNSDIIVRFEK